jgi:hypothetical protein
MKILFSGPTLHGLVRDGRIETAPDLVCRPPARQGDIFAAVEDGATVIGLVDGRFDDVAAPWHKEILHALSLGCTVLGAGSLGALRAAECAAFGMIGIGRVYESYASGARFDDSDVAQVHGPDEMEHLPLSEPRVNVEATLDALRDAGALDAATHARLTAAARRIHFADLSMGAVAEAASDDPAEVRRIAELLVAARVDQKRRDALELVAAMADLPARRGATPADWTLALPHRWLQFVARARGVTGAA